MKKANAFSPIKISFVDILKQNRAKSYGISSSFKQNKTNRLYYFFNF